MKKLQNHAEIILILTVIAFVAFTMGFFQGNNRPLETTLPDGTVITTERLNEIVTEQESKTSSEEESTQLININTALREELESLPGIGAELATRIMEHRDRIGGFRETSDICLVDGISEEIYETIKDLITVR